MDRDPRDPLLGSMVGSFRVERLLGQGGMGSVYLAAQPVIGSKVAIKFLHESMCGSRELVARFRDEARAVNLIGHENIVSVLDLVVLPSGRHAIVMEYLEGTQLSDLLRPGPLPLPDALEILLQLADALRAAHASGVVHRDLKPENVFLLERRGHPRFVKLMDFGIAKLASSTGGDARPTGAGVIVGTPEYMAPEQAEHGHADARSDVYALGVMAYQLATGRLPFTGDAVAQVLLAHIQRPPRPPRELEPSLPAAFEALVLRALAKRPEARFQDMAGLAAALEEVRAALAKPAGAGAQAEAPGRATPPVGGSVPPGRGISVEASWPGATAATRWEARLMTRGGLFLHGDAPPPPLQATVAITVRGGGGGPIDVQGEVVRQVSPAEAARWSMTPGFALQLMGAGPEVEAALARALGDPADDPRSGSGGAELDPAAARARLEALERRASSGLYQLLDLEQGAGFAEVYAAARALRADVAALRPALPAGDQVARVPELLARLDAAESLLGNAAERLMFDARRGNFRGVARCITAGVPSAVLEARRRTLLAEQPGRAVEAGRQLARAQVAARLGNLDAALEACEASLSADPLDQAAHASWRELARQRG